MLRRLRKSGELYGMDEVGVKDEMGFVFGWLLSDAQFP